MYPFVPDLLLWGFSFNFGHIPFGKTHFFWDTLLTSDISLLASPTSLGIYCKLRTYPFWQDSLLLGYIANFEHISLSVFCSAGICFSLRAYLFSSVLAAWGYAWHLRCIPLRRTCFFGDTLGYPSNYFFIFWGYAWVSLRPPFYLLEICF